MDTAIRFRVLAYIGTMEKKMETTVGFRVILGQWKRKWKLLLRVQRLGLSAS